MRAALVVLLLSASAFAGDLYPKTTARMVLAQLQPPPGVAGGNGAQSGGSLTLNPGGLTIANSSGSCLLTTVAGPAAQEACILVVSGQQINLGASLGQWFINGGGSNQFNTATTDSASAIGFTFNTSNAFATAGDAIVAFQNAGSTKATVDRNGNWSGPLHHTGDWSATMVSAAIGSQNFGVFIPSVLPPGQKLGNTICILNSATTGTGTAGTLIIKDVTGVSTLCTPYSGNFNCALAAGASFPASAGSVVSCNAALTAAHIYSYELSGCTSFPTGLECTAEILSP